LSHLPFFNEEKLDESHIETPKVKGVFISGKVEGKDVFFTVDTGAASTVLSERVWEQLPLDVRHIEESVKPSLVGPNGAPIKALGRAKLNLQLGPVSLQKFVAVADIQDECLLGADILLGLKEGPFDLLLSESRIKWNGKSFPCIRTGTATLRRVKCIANSTVPGNSEVVVDVALDGGSANEDLVIEPCPQFQERNQLVVASSVVNPGNPKSLKVRMMNPSTYDVELYCGETVGVISPIDKVQILFSSDEINEDADLVRNLSHSADSNRSSTAPAETQLPEHLVDLFTRSIEKKEAWMQQDIEKLLLEYQDIFSKDEFDLGCTHLAEHHIDTGDHKPIKQPPRRVPLALQGQDKQAIDDMLKRGAIRKSTSPWASPIVLVRKKNGSYRVCIDYRKVNEVTRKDSHPIPRIADCLDAVAGAKYFSTLDLTSGYNQIPVAPEDIPKTAFATKHGLFEATKLPFGLTNAPATFQRVMELALQGLQWNTALVYIDDIIIHAPTFKEHISRLRQVFDRLRMANLKIKPDKCHLLEDSVLFLGHEVSKDGVLPSQSNVDKVLNWPVPRSTKEVRQFLGGATYYRRFIKDFASKAKELSRLTSKNVDFYWNEECQKSFDSLKQALTSPEVMAYPTNDGYFILDTDASAEAIGSVLNIVVNGEERVVAYASKTLNKAERNYCVTDRELLAVRYFVEYFKHYLLGRKFTIRTDHQALKWLFTLKDPKGRIARWIEILSTYTFDIEYRPGKKHANADAMSRCPNPQSCLCGFDELKCGPCRKCHKRHIEMSGSMAEDKEIINQITEEPRTWSSKAIDLLVYMILIYRLCLNKGMMLSWLVPVSIKRALITCLEQMKQIKHKVSAAVMERLEDDGRLWPKLALFKSVSLENRQRLITSRVFA